MESTPVHTILWEFVGILVELQIKGVGLHGGLHGGRAADRC